ncbi:unnamed protein product [Oncorhynchus mykiss]|uniref:Uncharacterized protein n=1 Tax=Oncorhynchus mykiss TaxID=8022 RepID=A0A060ZDR1_ONCMY|nr:unnamed protein product [Oncorhynchus mykiss]
MFNSHNIVYLCLFDIPCRRLTIKRAPSAEHSPEDEDMDKSGTVKRSGVLSPALRHIISPSTDSTPSTVTPSVADSALAEPSLFNSTIFSDLSLSSNCSFEEGSESKGLWPGETSYMALGPPLSPEWSTLRRRTEDSVRHHQQHFSIHILCTHDDR